MKKIFTPIKVPYMYFGLLYILRGEPEGPISKTSAFGAPKRQKSGLPSKSIPTPTVTVVGCLKDFSISGTTHSNELVFSDLVKKSVKSTQFKCHVNPSFCF